MVNWIAPIAVIGATIAAMIIARRWLWRRWLSGGMSPTRVAFWSVAITYVPLLLGLMIWTWISGRPMSFGNWLIILVALALPVAVGFGFRRAVFAYMERYVVPDARRR